MATKRSKGASRTTSDEPEELPEDDERLADDAEQIDDVDDGDGDEPAAGDAPQPRSSRRAADDGELAPPPIRLFALFIVPLLVLLLWAMFLK